MAKADLLTIESGISSLDLMFNAGKKVFNNLPVQRGKRFKIYYGSQTKTNPPEFIIFSNFAKNLPNPFRKFFERSIRKEYGFDGISFKLSFRTTRKE